MRLFNSLKTTPHNILLPFYLYIYTLWFSRIKTELMFCTFILSISWLKNPVTQSEYLIKLHPLGSNREKATLGKMRIREIARGAEKSIFLSNLKKIHGLCRTTHGVEGRYSGSREGLLRELRPRTPRLEFWGQLRGQG
jgi:hypothetical protein